MIMFEDVNGLASCWIHGVRIIVSGFRIRLIFNGLGFSMDLDPTVLIRHPKSDETEVLDWALDPWQHLRLEPS